MADLERERDELRAVLDSEVCAAAPAAPGMCSNTGHPWASPAGGECPDRVCAWPQVALDAELATQAMRIAELKAQLADRKAAAGS